MCLIKEWDTGNKVEFAWKIFSVKGDGKLYPMKTKYDLGKSFDTNSWISCKDSKGFHCFITRENAEITLNTVIEFQKLFPDKFPSNQFVVRKVEIKEITVWGFSIRNRSDFVDVIKHEIAPKEPNSLRTKEIKIIE